MKYYSCELRITKTSIRSRSSSKCDLSKINFNLKHLKKLLISNMVNHLIYNNVIGLWLLPQLLFSVDTGRKLNVHKTFRRLPGGLLNVLCTFNLRPVSTGVVSVAKF